jgi:type II secretory pathway pseudopilin PulG
MRTILNRLKERKASHEGGFTVAEIMVSAIVIAIILVSAAYGMTAAIKSTAFVENQSKAQQLAQQQIAIAKQAPYRQLWLARTTAAANVGTGKCDPTTTAAPSGYTWATTGKTPQFNGLTYCFTKRFGTTQGVGTTFYVQTTIAYVNTAAAFDNSSLGGTTNTRYFAKRVTVTVRWQDVSSGTNPINNFAQIQQTLTRTPAVTDCVPNTVTYSGSAVAGCQP